jgi:hypothetical protein
MHSAMEATVHNKMKVLYKHTSKMVADGLAKTPVGAIFPKKNRK